MARKRKEEAEKTCSRILASALELFSKKGYERTSFTDIAARLKLTKGAVYWHFASKEALLVALVQLAHERFSRQLETLFPKGELTFSAVADMMVRNAEAIVEDPRGAAFFRLMKCQIRWSDASMEKVREDLMAQKAFGPKCAFKTALANDVASGRARADLDADEIASVCLAIWDGLVQARIDHFLSCDLAATLTHAYAAIWASIKTN